MSYLNLFHLFIGYHFVGIARQIKAAVTSSGQYLNVYMYVYIYIYICHAPKGTPIAQFSRDTQRTVPSLILICLTLSDQCEEEKTCLENSMI
jgi:hypothetical protein